MMLQAAGRALQAGMLQEEGNLLCQMQTSRCEKSGCAGGRKDFASQSVSSKASHLPLLLPPARRDSPASVLGGLKGDLCPPRMFLWHFCITDKKPVGRKDLVWGVETGAFLGSGHTLSLTSPPSITKHLMFVCSVPVGSAFI